MVICASLLFGLGGRLLKYVIPDNRLADLKTSGLTKNAKDSISLIGLSLYPFANEEWMNIFESKLKNGVKIKLLIVDPETEFAKYRHTSLRDKNKYLSDDINTSINIFRNFKSDISEKLGGININFEVRLYTSNASMSTFIFDDEARLGLMIENGTGLTAPEIRISNSGKQVDLFRIITDHFGNVWDKATDIFPTESGHG
jgi:hypothetical protein